MPDLLRLAITQLPLKTTMPWLAILVVCLLTFVPLLLNVNMVSLPHDSYLPLHTTLEIFAVTVSAMVFAVAQERALTELTLRNAIIASAFFAVMWFDLAHLLSFDGMPGYFGQAGAEQGINFWLAGRVTAAIALLFVVQPHTERLIKPRLYFLLLALSSLTVVLVHIWFLNFPQWVPATFVAGQGLTKFKVATEYLIISIHALTVLLLMLQRAPKLADSSLIIRAVLLMALAEFYFTLYVGLSDIYNITGHIIKVIAYILLYRVLVHNTLSGPFYRLQESRAELAGTLAAIPDMLIEVGADERFYKVHCRPNSQPAQISANATGRLLTDVLPADALYACRQAIAEAAQHEMSTAKHFAIEGDEARWFQVIAAPKPDNNKETQHHFILSIRDITEQKKARAAEQLNALAFYTREGIMITDNRQRIIRVNPAFTEITGYTEAEVIGKKPSMLSSGKHDKAFYDNLWQNLKQDGLWSGEIYNKRKNGEIFPEHVVINALKDDADNITHYIASFSDITKAKADQLHIHQLAYFDPLTQLPNRRLLQEKISTAQKEAKRNELYYGLFFIDLDHFKRLNDSYGHSYGDALLCQIANRLSNIIRETDTLSRPGGDEFVLLAQLNTANLDAAIAEAECLGDKLLTAIRLPYQLNEHQYQMTASIGIVVFNDDSQAIDKLMSFADLAMYHSKERGRDQLFFFEQAMQQALIKRQHLEQGLKNAIANQEFCLYYQPKFDRQQQLAGYEALIRWQHPVQGMIPPNDFIPLAESTGLIIPIGQWVIEQACQQIKRFMASNKPLPIAVNVSQRQLAQADFVEHARLCITQTGIDPTLLEFELTESMLQKNLTETSDKLTQLNALGVNLSLDDFGTGYSSLSYLKQLPIQVLKIDQSFVRDFLADDTDRAIVHTIIAMAKALQLQVIAEGVETEGQYHELIALDCDLFQGYLFGKPAPLVD